MDAEASLGSAWLIGVGQPVGASVAFIKLIPRLGKLLSVCWFSGPSNVLEERGCGVLFGSCGR